MQQLDALPEGCQQRSWGYLLLGPRSDGEAADELQTDVSKLLGG
jgi:hypothetical protein